VAGRLGRARLTLTGLAHHQEDAGDQGHGADDPGRHGDDRVEQPQFGAAAGVEIDDRLKYDTPVPARVAVVCSSSGNLTIWPLT
jgi:hypothetical protein